MGLRSDRPRVPEGGVVGPSWKASGRHREGSDLRSSERGTDVRTRDECGCKRKPYETRTRVDSSGRPQEGFPEEHSFRRVG